MSFTSYLNRAPIQRKQYVLVAVVSIATVVVMTVASVWSQWNSSKSEVESILNQTGQDLIAHTSQRVEQSLGTLQAFALSEDLLSGTTAARYQEEEELLLELDQAWKEGTGGAEERVHAIEQSSISASLLRAQAAFPEFAELFVTDVRGYNVGMTERVGDFFQGDEVWWQEAASMESGQQYVGDVSYDESAKTYALTMAVPMRAASGDLVGVLRGTADVTQVFAVLDERRTDERTVTLLGRDGLVLSTGTETQELLVPASPAFLKAQSEGEGWYTIPDLEGDESYVVLQSSRSGVGKQLEWWIATGQKRGPMIASLVVGVWGSVALGLLVLVIMLYVGGSLGKRIAQPMGELAEGARRVADSDLTTQIELQTQDEVGMLAGVFNQMVSRMRETLEEVEAARRASEHAREQAVEQRAVLARQVEIMLEATSRFSEGNMTVRLPDDVTGDIGRLFTGFNQAVEALEAAFLEVSETSQQVVQSTEDIQVATQHLSEGFEQQASQSLQVASAVEEMTVTLNDTASNAARTAQLAEVGRSVVKDGQKLMGSTLERIQQTATVFAGTQERVASLGDASKRIGDVIGVISEIAEQTNLLALNATIEAARAGEQGRGFAVVAEEVRKLADRTGQATQQIAEMIHGVQSETDSVFASIEEGKREVEAGLELAEQAGSAFSVIFGNMDETTQMTQQIAVANEEQEVVSRQISESTGIISRASNEAVSEVSLIRRTTNDLGDSTQRLHVLLSRFTLSYHEATVSAATPHN